MLGWKGNTRAGVSEAWVAKKGLICFHLDIEIEQRGWVVVEEYDKDTKTKSPSDAVMTFRLLQESTGLPEGVRLDFRVRY